MKKETENAQAAVQKLKSTLTKATNRRKKKAKKKQKEIDRQKMEAIAEKQRKNRGRNNLSIENDGYYNNDIFGTDPNQEKALDLLKNLNDSQISSELFVYQLILGWHICISFDKLFFLKVQGTCTHTRSSELVFQYDCPYLLTYCNAQIRRHIKNL